jgi:hypothetical protein
MPAAIIEISVPAFPGAFLLSNVVCAHQTQAHGVLFTKCMKTSDALRGLKVTNECFLHDSAHPAIPLMMKPGVLHHRVIENYAFAPLVVTRKLPGGIV